MICFLTEATTLSEALPHAKKQHCKVKFCNWGPITIWHNIESVAFFFFKITPPYCAALLLSCLPKNVCKHC